MFLLFLIMLVCCIYIIRTTNNQKLNSGLLYRFKKRFNSNKRLKERLSEEFNNSLMADPEYNINIASWYSEKELIEKADIHRARLKKYGRSKMNGEILFLAPEGEVYKITSQGKKIYV